MPKLLPPSSMIIFLPCIRKYGIKVLQENAGTPRGTIYLRKHKKILKKPKTMQIWKYFYLFKIFPNFFLENALLLNIILQKFLKIKQKR